MPNLKTRRQVLLGKLQADPNIPEMPSALTDAIKCSNIKVTVDPKKIETNEHQPTLDKTKPIIGGQTAMVTFDVLLKGSGNPTTAPEFASALRACGFSQTTLATAVPPAAEAAVTGTASTLTLSTGAAGTEDLYRGMPIILGNNPDDISLIDDYTASKIARLIDTYTADMDGTTTYQIPENVTYTLSSINLPAITFWAYLDGKLEKVSNCAGNVSLSVTAAELGMLKFSFKGSYGGMSDAPIVDANYDNVLAPVWRDNKMNIDGQAAKLNMIEVDLNNTVVFTPDPNTVQGVGVAEITERSVSGGFDPNEDLVANQTIMADFTDGVDRSVGLIIGKTAGNRIGITLPSNRYVDNPRGDREGIATRDVNFVCGDEENAIILTFF